MDEDGAELLPRSGPLAYGDGIAAAKALRQEAQRLLRQGGFAIDPDTGLPDILAACFHD